MLDRDELRRGGATALTWRDGAFAADPARPIGLDRPWARNVEAGRAAASPDGAAANFGPGTRPQRRDATPLTPDADAEEYDPP